MRFFSIAVALTLLAGSAFAQRPPRKLDPLLARADLWETGADAFVEQQRSLGFHWVSEAKDSAESMAPGVTLFDSPVVQTIARFSGEKLAGLTVLFYSRGDAGDMSEAKFRELYDKVSSELTATTGKKPAVLGRDATSAVKAFGIEWKTDTLHYLLEYSVTKEVKTRGIPFRAEFVRLAITPPHEDKGVLQSALAERDAAKAKFSGPGHLIKEPSGDVFISDMPMIDQGPKGYCVVASAERVLRYYGENVDQHELAQVANSSAAAGTSVGAMIDSLKALTQRLRIRVRTLQGFDEKEIQALIKDYNRLTKRGKVAPEIDPRYHLSVAGVYEAMNPELLKEARTKNKGDTTKFLHTIEASVNEGVPVLWSVMLGVIKEPEIPQASGGHMRLIIGYNEKNNEILYTDSWGMGHEKKRMAVDDAWTITTTLNTIEPI